MQKIESNKMGYILFNKNTIFGSYKTLQLLKANCFVFLYQMYKEGQVEDDIYMEIRDVLMENFELDIKNLKEIMFLAEIGIQYQKNEESGLYALENILLHIRDRFDNLEAIMGKDSRVNVTIPGNNAVENLMITSSIENHWRLLDPDNYDVIMKELIKYLILRIQKLQMKFESRVSFGPVSDTEASELSYQLWPADKENWNLKDGSIIPGDGLAVCFEYQVPGVYGIVIDPLFGYKDL